MMSVTMSDETLKGVLVATAEAVKANIDRDIYDIQKRLDRLELIVCRLLIGPTTHVNEQLEEELIAEVEERYGCELR
jgi:hypothetical protein